MKKIILLFWIIAIAVACNQQKDANKKQDPLSVRHMQALAKSLNEIIVYDIFSPPVASRIYAYATLAAYESIRNTDTTYPSLTAQLHDFGEMPKPDLKQEYDFRIAAVRSFFNVARKLTFTKDSIDLLEKRLIDSIDLDPDKQVLERSLSFGKSISDSILARASRDHYKQIQGMARYFVKDALGKWKNTPPDYLDAVQPYWNLMRPLVMDSASQFKPITPPPFSTNKNSEFYKDLLEVYDVSKKLNDSTIQIAKFWDDNASASTHVGHLTMNTKKPSPGGHWINITSIASEKANQNWIQSAQTFAIVSVAMYDGFISCWDEKYRSEYIRPVTAINELLDEKWEPLLQTPPFPEYTSGHSVVSSAIASVLTQIFGNDFAFADTYELRYNGLQRSFTSFQHASEEACISRLYGGIHFKPAIENGKIQGRTLGAMIGKRIKL